MGAIQACCYIMLLQHQGEEDGVCAQEDACGVVCEDLSLPEPAALCLTSTIKAASEYRSIFIPVKCQSRFLSIYSVI